MSREIAPRVLALPLLAGVAVIGCWGDPVAPGPMPVCSGQPAGVVANAAGASCRPKTVVEEEMRSRSEFFTACFEEAIRRNSHANGFTTIRFQVTRTGDVPFACVTKTDIQDAAFIACATDTMRGATFDPDPAAPCEVSTIEYPLVFVPEGP